MSMESTRTWNRRLIPKIGDVLVTTQRRLILGIIPPT